MAIELLLIAGLLLHAGFAAYILHRYVERATRWEVTLRKTMLEQVRVCLIGLLLAALIVGGVSAMLPLRSETAALIAFVLFQISWIFGQANVIPRLVTGSTFIAPWTFRQIWYGTVSSVVAAYVFVGAVSLGALHFIK